jgi:hypothetical protein
VCERVTAALRERREGCVARCRHDSAVRCEVAPELEPQQRLETVVGQERRPCVDAAEGPDLRQREHAGLDRVDPPRQAVATLFDAQRGAAGHHDLRAGVVDERLQLRRPVRQVLDLVEEQVRRFAALRRVVDGLAEHGLLVPLDESQHRRGRAQQFRQLVGLEPEDVRRRHAAREQVRDHVILRRRLADLARTSDHDDRGDPLTQPAMDLIDEVAPGTRQAAHRPTLPPRILQAQRRDDPLGELDPGEQGALLHGVWAAA